MDLSINRSVVTNKFLSSNFEMLPFCGLTFKLCIWSASKTILHIVMMKEPTFRATPASVILYLEIQWQWPQTQVNLHGFFSDPTQIIIFSLAYFSPLHLLFEGKRRFICLSLEAMVSLPRQLFARLMEGNSHCHLLAQEYDRKACIAASAILPQSHLHELFSVLPVGWALPALLPFLLGQPRDKETKISSF